MELMDDISKIKATVLYFLKASGGKMDFTSLFKKMYFAQKEYLLLYGHPIFNDSFHARRFGPVPAFTYKAFCCALNGFYEATEEIRRFDSAFTLEEVDGFRYVSAKEDPDMDEIAVAEKHTIDMVLKKYEGYTPQQLSEESHDAAWKKAMRRVADDPNDDYMSVVNIARAGGASKGMLAYIRDKQEFEAFCRE
ncbi:MAG: SocA family protein [Bacteroidales bacterium]